MFRKPLMLLTLVSLTACATPRVSAPLTPTASIKAEPTTAAVEVQQAVAASVGPSEKEKACAAWPPMLFDRLNDTLGTIARAKAINSARSAFCGL